MKIYTLSCPITNNIKYVGITKNSLSKRLSQHLAEKRNNKRKSWILNLRNKNLIPSMELLDEVSDNEWKDEEKFYISYFKFLGFDLVNMTDGGDRIEMTIEIRRKISKSHIGKKLSDETKRKIGLANVQGRCGTKGKKMSDYVKNIRSVSMKNRFVSDKTKLKMSLSSCKIQIVKMDLNDNELETYKSISECCKLNNYSKGNIIKVCKNKIRKDGSKCKTAYGYKWKYN